ncbi:MAG: putative 2-nitropropane dioxygenase (Nitroalkane oxidase) [Deltaproteobacteria bacterium]|jgi:enoyl-[acyl-carrier protein] reductase II|nr:putative 2-nitropropane dioxygenase (Nitroalkane oxidase) [Deltaproteobacteria bacterium]
MSDLLKMLGCRYPIIQGPIGEMNSPKLVAAICEAGAYGMLALGFSNAEKTKKLVNDVKALTDKPFGANLMLMNQANGEILDILAAAGVKTVTTSAGSPKEVYKRIHELGMKGIHVALTLTHARRAEDAGVDGLVITGLESGGLRSKEPELTNMVLIPLVVDHVKVPVVAAGGIADSRGYRAVLALGAQGAQIGTRFLASAESTAHDKWKQAILDSTDGDIVILPLQKMNVRVIVTQKLKKEMQDPALDLSKVYDLKNLPKAWGTGDFDLFPASAGQVSALIKEVKPVREIIKEMVS